MGSIPELSPNFSAFYKLQKNFLLCFSSSTGTYLYKNVKKLKTFYRYNNNSALVIDHFLSGFIAASIDSGYFVKVWMVVWKICPPTFSVSKRLWVQFQNFASFFQHFINFRKKIFYSFLVSRVYIYTKMQKS